METIQGSPKLREGFFEKIASLYFYNVSMVIGEASPGKPMEDRIRTMKKMDYNHIKNLKILVDPLDLADFDLKRFFGEKCATETIDFIHDQLHINEQQTYVDLNVIVQELCRSFGL